MTEPDICIAPHPREPDRPRRAADGMYLCHGCIESLRNFLQILPQRYADLEEVLGGGGDGGGQRVSGSASEPLPISAPVADHRHQIKHDLLWWCIYVADERGISRPEAPEPAVTAAWLLRHVDWCAANRPAAEELLPVVRQLAGRAWGLMNPWRKLPTGERCRTIDEAGERCDGAIVMRQGEDDLWSAWCPACGAQEAADYLHDGITGRWVTIERVEAYVLRVFGYRVARATIRKWVERERIQSKEERGKTWYELASVWKYLDDRRRREMMSA